MKRKENMKHAVLKKRKEPLISVIMCVYNPEDKAQLISAVRSIIQQKYSHWGLLLYIMMGQIQNIWRRFNGQYPWMNGSGI